MTSGPAANGRERGCRGLQASQWPLAGTYVLRTRSCHCPLPRLRRTARVSTLSRSAPPGRPLSLRTKVAGWLRGGSGRGRAGSACRVGARAHPSPHAVTLCGAARRGRGHRPGARGGRAAPGACVRGRAGSAAPGAAPRFRPRLAAEPSECGRERAGPAQGARRRPQARFVAVAAAGYSSCVAGVPEGRGRGPPPSYRRDAAGEPRSGGGDGDPPSVETVVPALSQGAPGRGTAGDAGPISILIAGLGAHLDRGLITGQTLRALEERARRSPITGAPHPPPGRLLPDDPPLLPF